MELQLQVAARDLTITEDTTNIIRREANRLERFYPRIMGCRVTLEAEHRFPSREPVDFAVRIDLTVPQKELPANRQRGDTLLSALQRAFEAARRQLQDFARIQRGDVGQPAAEPQGRVLRLNPWEGYGFLATAEGREIYFHRNSVLDDGFDRLAVGDRVRFVESEGEKGPQASTVVPQATRRSRRERSSRS